MLLFGHTGITLGTALLMRKAAGKPDSAPAQKKRGLFSRQGVPAILNRLDMRIVIIGSLLPDIIDKPIGIYLLKDTVSSGRMIAHTLLFFAAIAVAGIFLRRRRITTWLPALAFGTFTHLVFDQMWRSPHTLFWPLYGFAFEKKDLSDWVNETVQSLFTNPGDYVPELIGAAIITYFLVTLIRQKNLRGFIKTGRLT